MVLSLLVEHCSLASIRVPGANERLGLFSDSLSAVPCSLGRLLGAQCQQEAEAFLPLSPSGWGHAPLLAVGSWVQAETEAFLQLSPSGRATFTGCPRMRGAIWEAEAFHRFSPFGLGDVHLAGTGFLLPAGC